uniref:Uncharacterized protein n=1 Tax=Anguilla anguilla TaxID=7936 RepID=A0A0E9QYK1_ANGAN
MSASVLFSLVDQKPSQGSALSLEPALPLGPTYSGAGHSSLYQHEASLSQ